MLIGTQFSRQRLTAVQAFLAQITPENEGMGLKLSGHYLGTNRACSKSPRALSRRVQPFALSTL